MILIILVLAAFLLYKTAFGLRLVACGENLHAADAAGINVYLRYGAVSVPAVGGATILVTYSGEFTAVGRWHGLLLALAALIFGQWKPTGVPSILLAKRTLANASQAEPALKALKSYSKSSPTSRRCWHWSSSPSTVAPRAAASL